MKTKELQKIINAKIIGKNKAGDFLVDASMKTEYILKAQEFDSSNMPKIGDEIKVIVISDNLVSHKKAEQQLIIKNIKNNYMHKKRTIEAIVSGSVVGGYSVYLAPFPQITGVLHTTKPLKTSDSVLVLIIALLNHKQVKVELKSNIGDQLKIGDLVHAKVITRGDNLITANVEVGEHLYEAILQNPQHTVEDKFFAKVLSIEPTHINLVLENSNKNIWANKITNYQVNNSYEGLIKYIDKSWIIVELEEDVEGFLHCSEIYWGSKEFDLNKDFNIGDKLNCYILSINHKRKKIDLSLKKNKKDPFEEFSKNHKEGDIINATVVKSPKDHNNMFAFLNIFNNNFYSLDGFLHFSEFAWKKQDCIDMIPKLIPGAVFKVKIIKLDNEEKKISLSIKRVTSNEFTDKIINLKFGQTYNCEVMSYNKQGLVVSLLMPDILIEFPVAFINQQELPNDIRYKIGDKLQAKLIYIDYQKHSLYLSVKAYQKEIDQKRMVSFQQKNKKETQNVGNLFEEW